MAVMFLAQPGCCRCLSLTARTYTQQMLLNCPGKEAAGLMEKEVHIFLGKKILDIYKVRGSMFTLCHILQEKKKLVHIEVN